MNGLPGTVTRASTALAFLVPKEPHDSELPARDINHRLDRNSF
jgi:hypothetical protein